MHSKSKHKNRIHLSQRHIKNNFIAFAEHSRKVLYL